MKNVKTMAMTLALVAGITGTAFAADIREIVGDPGTEITDRNPTCYQTRVFNGHTLESYVENDVAVTKRARRYPSVQNCQLRSQQQSHGTVGRSTELVIRGRTWPPAMLVLFAGVWV